jgi:hypothetical protein
VDGGLENVEDEWRELERADVPSGVIGHDPAGSEDVEAAYCFRGVGVQQHPHDGKPPLRLYAKDLCICWQVQYRHRLLYGVLPDRLHFASVPSALSMAA